MQRRRPRPTARNTALEKAKKTRNMFDASAGISLDDFYAYMPQHNYIYTPSCETWSGCSVNARIPPIEVHVGKFIPASLWLDRNRPVEQMTWAPGLPMIIRNRLISQGGWIQRSNVSCFNHYQPPRLALGDAARAGPWLDHVHKIYPDDAVHIVKYLAHRVQRPGEKLNHALVLGGAQGIGKDTLLEAVKHAIGHANFHEVLPPQLMGRFNKFVKSVILRVNEARDLGEINRYQFYEHLKTYTAAPPNTLRIDEKNLPEYYIFNCCGVIISTNYKTDGIYLPADDRRHYVAWSELTKDDFDDSYWRDLYRWYDNGGFEHVAAYLASVDLSGFNAKAPPPKTLAFWEIVDASRAPEDAELADVIDKMGQPETLTLSQTAARATKEFSDWLLDRKNARRIPHRLEACGYIAVRNSSAKDGQWKVDGKRQTIYAKASLSLRDRTAAVMKRAGAR